MKREIICNVCKDELRELFPTNTPYPGEFLKFVKGKALRNYICDRCGKSISSIVECWAFSIYTKKYYQWEGEYLDLNRKFCSICGGAIGNRGEMGYIDSNLDVLYCENCYFSTEKFQIIHGVNCEKAEHVGSGYLHDDNDDAIYDVDGVTYCGRCHLSF